jgi:hypothetical protein
VSVFWSQGCAGIAAPPARRRPLTNAHKADWSASGTVSRRHVQSHPDGGKLVVSDPHGLQSGRDPPITECRVDPEPIFATPRDPHLEGFWGLEDAHIVSLDSLASDAVT